MARLTLLPPGKTIEVETGIVLLDAIRRAGFEIAAPCNGRQQCGKCKVRIDAPALAPEGQPAHLTAAEAAAGLRLACQTRIDADMQVTLPAGYSMDTRILEGERIRQSRLRPAPRIEKDNGRFQLTYRRRPPVWVDNWQTHFTPKGIAVDLGTTTLVVSLMDLLTGRELAIASAVNPQSRYGHDVMTRIDKASDREGLAELARLVSDGLNALIDKLCRSSGTQPHEIVDAVIGGNPAMLQIAAAIDPSALGRAPFAVELKGGCTYSASRFGLNLNPVARVYIPPVVQAFVGADISAGLLSTGFFKQERPLLFIDLGTNGEMALIVEDRAFVTSTAAGPAFEGMGISHGMRAAAGAIEMVWTSGEYLNMRTIADKPPRGICGSGILDIMACLVRLGAVDSGGRLRNPRTENTPPGPLAERYTRIDGVTAVELADGICFTQPDIRQFQLAKSAIQTGAEMLLEAAGAALAQLDRIVIAGAFGYHLQIDSLRQIGMVPRAFNGRIDFAGNTCRTGCALLLADAARRDFLEEKMRQVTHLPLAGAAAFQSRFVRNLSLAT